MKLRYLYSLLFVPIVLFAGCEKSDDSTIDFPYYAQQERTNTIKTGADELYTGMFAEEVRGIIGEPDKIEDIYRVSPGNKPGVNGYSYIYTIQQLSPTGTDEEKGEIYFRVDFNNDNILTHTERIGF